VDEAIRLKLPATLPRLLISPCRLLLLFIPLTGCLSPEPKPFPAPSPDAFRELTRSVAEWRQLPLARPIRLQIQPGGVETGQNVFPSPINGPSPAQLEQAYKAIGLLPNHVDFSTALAEYRKIVELISYDGPKDLVILSAHAARLAAPLERSNPSAAHELPAVIGVMRALQERHFNWRERINSSAFDDRRMALRAVAMGDALLTAVSRGAGEKLAPANLAALQQIAAAVDQLASHLPDFLRQQASFPYREGGQFVYWALAAKGWQGVDALYADPPRTTAQVLHPETYFIERNPLTHFFPAALLRRLRTNSLVEDSIGELSIRTLLEGEYAKKYAADTAAAWRADQLFSFQNDADLNTFWFSSWGSETAAEEFGRAYRKVIESRQRLRFDRVAQAKDLALIGAARDGRTWLLQARGPVVLVVQSATANRATELAEEAWKDLESEAEPTVVRFESARRPINFR
jgi:hypothetical protein